MHFIDFCFQKLFSVKILPSAKNYWKKNYLMFNYIISKAICHIHHKHQIPRKDRAKILLDQTYDQQALTWLLGTERAKLSTLEKSFQIIEL